MIELVRPTVDLCDSWWALVDAFAGATIHGSSYRSGDRDVLAGPDAFAEWVDWLGRMERPAEALPEGRVASSNRWIVEDGRVVGTIAIRHALTPSLLVEGGHIGYAVGPADRGRGVASAALGLALDLAARRGIDPALVTCDVDNVASARTIDRAVRERGGLVEDSRDGVRRTWVRTGAVADALGTSDVETASTRLRLVDGDRAAALVAGGVGGVGGVGGDSALGYPRQDDLDALGSVPAGPAGPWSVREIVRQSDGALLGTIGFYGPPDGQGRVEIGYGLVEAARGAGLMTEVLGAMVRSAEATGARVTAHTEPDNVATHRVLARLGFAHVPGEDSDSGEWLWVRGDAGPVGVA